MAASLLTAITVHQWFRVTFPFFSRPLSDSFDQDHGLAGLSLVGTAVCVFGVVGAWASQVQKAEACFQAKALLDAGSRAVAVAVAVGGGGSVVQFPLCTFRPVAYKTSLGSVKREGVTFFFLLFKDH